MAAHSNIILVIMILPRTNITINSYIDIVHSQNFILGTLMSIHEIVDNNNNNDIYLKFCCVKTFNPLYTCITFTVY